LDATLLEDAGLWRVSVRLTTQDPLHPTLERRIDLAIGLGSNESELD
jgi:hypothetical protein